MKLTKTIVEKTPPPPYLPNGKSAQTFLRDTTTPGFGLRITSNGSRAYIVEKRIDGKVRRKTIAKVGSVQLESARLIAMKHLTLIAEKKNPLAIDKAQRVKQTTLRQAFDDYLKVRKNLRPATVKDYRRTIEGALADWQHIPLMEISRDMVELRHRELGSRSHARANNSMRVLRAMFNFARGQYEDEKGNPVFLHNPIDRIKHNRGWYKVQPRRGYIKLHQLQSWYEGTQQLAYETSRDYLQFLLFTGLRRSEGQTLAWENVDFKDRTFTIPITKNHQPHTLPFSDFTERLLKARYDDNIFNSPFVFPSDSKVGYLVEPKAAVDTVKECCGFHFTLHDLRRTFITIAESLDISSYALKRLLNHKNPNDVTDRYIITDVERLREPMQRICDHISAHIEIESVTGPDTGSTINSKTN